MFSRICFVVLLTISTIKADQIVQQSIQRVEDESISSISQQVYSQQVDLLPLDSDSGFSCEGRSFGYYADVARDCRVFYVCQPIPTTNKVIRNVLTCPLGTRFDQEVLACAADSEAIECARSVELYNSSSEKFKVRSTPVPSQATFFAQQKQKAVRENQEPQRTETEPVQEVVKTVQKQTVAEWTPVESGFSCAQRGFGYYADVVNDCRVFYICGSTGVRTQLACPSETRFDQGRLACTGLQEAMDCAKSPELYAETEKRFQVPLKQIKLVEGQQTKVRAPVFQGPVLSKTSSPKDQKTVKSPVVQKPVVQKEVKVEPVVQSEVKSVAQVTQESIKAVPVTQKEIKSEVPVAQSETKVESVPSETKKVEDSSTQTDVSVSSKVNPMQQKEEKVTESDVQVQKQEEPKDETSQEVQRDEISSTIATTTTTTTTTTQASARKTIPTQTNYSGKDVVRKGSFVATRFKARQFERLGKTTVAGTKV